MTTLARIRTIFTGVAGTPWYSNIYFDADATTGAGYAADVAAFWATCAPQMSSAVDYTVESTYGVIDDATGNLIGIGSWAGATGGGSNTNAPLPFSNQALVNWTTGAFLGGRQVRGKTFIPALTTPANDNGVLGAATRAVFLAAAEELLSDGNGALRVYSPKNLTSAAVTDTAVPTLIAVLRSRRD